MDTRVWFSRRALRLHVVILIVVPGFMALCAWQVSRALGGNTLSWAYVFEWPLFAVYAVYMWWRLVHEAPTDGPPATATNGSGGLTGTRQPATAEPHAAAQATVQDSATQARQEKEDAELAAYNEYLAQLAEQDEAAGR